MANLDRLFHALSDPTRRAVIEQLIATGPQPVSILASSFPMALPSFLKHLRALEAAGVITSEKRGRVRLCRLRSEALLPMQDWLADHRSLWEGRADRLADFVEGEGSET